MSVEMKELYDGVESLKKLFAMDGDTIILSDLQKLKIKFQQNKEKIMKEKEETLKQRNGTPPELKILAKKLLCFFAKIFN